ncbi:MAG: inosine monophosphate cyclohydrolase [Firmicutes bacterium]|nr:inosine monophosphate cyclohydrolase [Bacillota bacterium]
MNVYETPKIGDLIRDNSYVGRGILLGKTPDGTKAAIAYFIMGRSENSRNRIFREEGDAVTIYPYDPSKVEDPSLIIYSPVRVYENNLIVTNGDQTDTIYDGLAQGKCFRRALKSRQFEPDGPNWTPRISGMITFEDGDFTYAMSILKSGDGEGSFCNRFTYDYGSSAGVGHLIHTYMGDGNPLPTFQGEPRRVEVPDSIDALTEEIWKNLNGDNKISLYVRYVDLKTGQWESRMINKNEK